MTSTHPTAPVPDPGPDGNSTSTSESRADRFVRFGRRARLYAGAVAFVVLLSGLIVLISANTHSVKLSWAAGSTRAAGAGPSRVSSIDGRAAWTSWPSSGCSDR